MRHDRSRRSRAGVYRAGIVEFVDKAQFERETEQLATQGLLWVRGEGLPGPLEEFELAVKIPDGPSVALTGKIILSNKGESLIEVRLGRDAFVSTLTDLKFPDRRKERRMLPRSERRLNAMLGKEVCHTYDVSPAGACLVTLQPLAVGAIVQGNLVVHQKTLPFTAEVRWSVQAEPGVKDSGRVGLRLLSVSPEYYALFKEGGVPTIQATPVPKNATSSGGAQRNQRRQLPRTRKRFKVKITAGGTGFTFDVSPKGMGIELLNPIQPGTVVSGKITVGTQDLPFTAQVRWARAGLPAVGVRARVGLLFQSIPNDYFEIFKNVPTGS